VSYSAGRLANRSKPATAVDANLEALLLTTKFNSWNYEREFRVIMSLRTLVREEFIHFYAFDNDIYLAEVILGPLCSLDVNSVRDLTRTHHPSATTIRSRLAHNFFSVVPDESTVPLYSNPISELD
jgi:hypothetical protein